MEGWNFTQAICDSCWEQRRSGEPYRLKEKPAEICCMCGRDTHSGIYIRVRPGECYYPSKEK